MSILNSWMAGSVFKVKAWEKIAGWGGTGEDKRAIETQGLTWHGAERTHVEKAALLLFPASRWDKMNRRVSSAYLRDRPSGDFPHSVLHSHTIITGFKSNVNMETIKKVYYCSWNSHLMTKPFKQMDCPALATAPQNSRGVCLILWSQVSCHKFPLKSNLGNK